MSVVVGAVVTSATPAVAAEPPTSEPAWNATDQGAPPTGWFRLVAGPDGRLGVERFEPGLFGMASAALAVAADEDSPPGIFADVLLETADLPAADPPTTELDQTWGITTTGFPQAWASGGTRGLHDHDQDPLTPDEPVVVAVLDAGVDTTHPELAARAVDGFSIVGGIVTSEPAGTSSVCGDHGTHVAGTIAAAEDGVGVVGAAPEVAIMSGGVLLADAQCRGYTSDVVAGIIEATDRGADVINLSLGGPASSDAFASAIDYARSQGVVVVAAAGNCGRTAATSLMCSINYAPGFSFFPGSSPSAVSVAAVNEAMEPADFSNRSDAVDLSAPGVMILSTAGSDDYGYKNGTSMATPLVSAAAALVVAADPGGQVSSTTGSARAEIIESLLISTADDLGSSGWDPHYGHGLVNPDAAVGGSGTDHRGSTATAPSDVEVLPIDGGFVLRSPTLWAGQLDWTTNEVALDTDIGRSEALLATTSITDPVSGAVVGKVFFDPDLTNGTPVTVVSRPIGDGSGSPPWTIEAEITPTAGWGVPSAPSALETVEQSTSRVSLSWSAATARGYPVTSYLVEVLGSDGVTPVSAQLTESTSITLDGEDGLVSSGTRTVRVRAVSRVGPGPAVQAGHRLGTVAPKVVTPTPIHRPGVVGPLGPVTIDTSTGRPVPLDTGAPEPERLVAVAQLSDGSRQGTWAADPEGRLYVSGEVVHHGDLAGVALNKPVLGMTPTASGDGYWMVASDGGIFSFGDAEFFGSTGDVALVQPINGMAVTPSGEGYYLVAADGGVFSFGDAEFFGSTGDVALVQPINGMAVTPSGEGYWLVASDGGVFSFGDADFHGSLGGTELKAPVVGMIATASGRGYWLIDAVGNSFPFGDAG